MIFDNGNYDFLEAYRSLQTEVRLLSVDRYEDGVLTLIENDDNFGDPFCFDNRLRFRPGEVTVWGGINGHGKSLLTGQVALQLATAGRKVAILSFEMEPRRTIYRMMHQSFGGKPTVMLAEQWLAQYRQSLFVLNHKGAIDIPTVLGACIVASRDLQCTHIFIDNLMRVVAKEDDLNGQKLFVQRCCEAADIMGAHIHIVHHVRKGEKEEDKIDKFSFKGSSSVIDQVDNAILIQRNRKKEIRMEENERNGVGMAQMAIDDEQACDTAVRVVKQRNGNWEGTVPLWYDRDGMSFHKTVARNDQGIGIKCRGNA